MIYKWCNTHFFLLDIHKLCTVKQSLWIVKCLMFSFNFWWLSTPVSLIGRAPKSESAGHVFEHQSEELNVGKVDWPMLYDIVSYENGLTPDKQTNTLGLIERCFEKYWIFGQTAQPIIIIFILKRPQHYLRENSLNATLS